MALHNFINNIKNLWVGTEDMYVDTIVPSLIGKINAEFNITNAESISSVYTCIKILSETVSRMPLNVYSDKGEGRTTDKEDFRYSLLHYNPNNWTSSQTFFSALEYWRNLKGNSFARIYRTNGRPTSLVLIPPSKVTGYAISGNELYYSITNDKGGEDRINSSELLHFRGLTKDGIWGLSPIEALKMNLSSSYQALQTLDNFYKNNTASPKALKSTVSGANQKSLIEATSEFERKYSGAQNAGKIITLPPNTEIIDMALNFGDAEFISSLKFNATQIAALYGVPAWMVGILEQTKFASVETTQREFMATTLGSILRCYRQELESKLLTPTERINGISIEFNTEAYFELDSKSRIENLRTLANLGVISINDIAKMEGWAQYPEGDAHLVPGNYLDVKQIVNKKTDVK
jgi:HK97 family phage portal protein